MVRFVFSRQGLRPQKVWLRTHLGASAPRVSSLGLTATPKKFQAPGEAANNTRKWERLKETRENRSTSQGCEAVLCLGLLVLRVTRGRRRHRARSACDAACRWSREGLESPSSAPLRSSWNRSWQAPTTREETTGFYRKGLWTLRRDVTASDMR